MQLKLHGKKRSYFFKKTTIERNEKENTYITITASKQTKDGKAIRSSIQIYQVDLDAFIESLQNL